MLRLVLPVFVVSLLLGRGAPAPADEPPCFSGRYPHLAFFNHQNECGVGAVAPWAGRLWVTTYAPHRPKGSDDGLYEITPDLKLTRRPESVGGTPANRMIHRESRQLFISHYAIDAKGNVRVISPKVMPGRLTGTARHLTDPAGKVYHYTMEEGLYEVDVTTLAFKTLYPDGNVIDQGIRNALLPGYHGKGAYTGHGRLVVANNGEPGVGRGEELGVGVSGSLAEWDGRDWHVVERKQFTEVTGPGGIYGNARDEDPLWTTGWDHRSLILKVLDTSGWHTFRLPIACYSYVARHGWHTEWPRIREVVPAAKGRPPKLLMTMHGGWFEFPRTFSSKDTRGLRAIGSHLKITGDFCGWRGRIVFGCDDAALSSFVKTDSGPRRNLVGQSQSNLWFTTWDELSRAGRPMGWGGPWVHDTVAAGTVSDPFLTSGYGDGVLHLSHATAEALTVTIEVKTEAGWRRWKDVSVPARGYRWLALPDDLASGWVRLRVDRDAEDLTAFFHFGPGGGALTQPDLLASLAPADPCHPRTAALLRPRGEDLGTLLIAGSSIDDKGRVTRTGAYEIGPDMHLRGLDDTKPDAWLREAAPIEGPGFTVDDASVIVTEGERRFRLPRGDETFDEASALGWPRGVREVSTERWLFNAHGSFYLLPRRNSGGARRIKPIATHNRRIYDFCSWRGLLVMSGCRRDARPDGHVVRSDDGRLGLWFGDVDDLWRLGKPRGFGGPWKDTPVKAGERSDPYLMAGYDRKSLRLSHTGAGTVRMTLEVDVLADGSWCVYRSWDVPPGEAVTHAFPKGYSAHWARMICDRPCRATAKFEYE